MWLKYSEKPIEFDPSRTYPQAPRLSVYAKPNGFWITDDSDMCWRTWCESEDYGAEELACKHRVEIDESRMLFLRQADEILAFTREWSVEREWMSKTSRAVRIVDVLIDWQRVAGTYAGLIITPYQWSVRFGSDTSWYYGWDCASGCIWDAGAIRSVELLVDA